MKSPVRLLTQLRKVKMTMVIIWIDEDGEKKFLNFLSTNHSKEFIGRLHLNPKLSKHSIELHTWPRSPGIIIFS